MKAKNLGRLKSVALSAAEINSGVIFGLASGEIASLKFDAEANLTSKQTGATNLDAEANLGDKENANLMNSTNLETKNSASTETKAAPNLIAR